MKGNYIIGDGERNGQSDFDKFLQKFDEDSLFIQKKKGGKER
jgi:hypothetical protein